MAKRKGACQRDVRWKSRWQAPFLLPFHQKSHRDFWWNGKSKGACQRDFGWNLQSLVGKHLAFCYFVQNLTEIGPKDLTGGAFTIRSKPWERCAAEIEKLDYTGLNSCLPDLFHSICNSPKSFHDSRIDGGNFDHLWQEILVFCPWCNLAVW